MSLKKILFLVLAIQVSILFLLSGTTFALQTSCLECHKKETPGIVNRWEKSKHYDVGVSCLTCHQTDKTDPTAKDHQGATVSSIVSPEDCSSCHSEKVQEFHNSMHDEAAFFSAGALNKTNGSNNNVLTLFNSTIGEAGCNKCHGSIVKVKNGELSNWPNAGIGRINPDGSVGNCGSCHPEHKFSLEFARSPKSCASCHLGPWITHKKRCLKDQNTDRYSRFMKTSII